jgi:HAD superfamily hydrolase (TIGR01509 family)
MDKVDQRCRTVVVECAAILFDMDGTLVDSTSVVERQWKAFAEKYKLDYEHIMRVSHGRRNTETIREIAPHLATPEVFAEFDAAELDDRRGVSAVKGAARLLAQLAEQEWAVVTSASRALARNRLKTVDLPVPNVLIGADDVSEGKPDPQGYLLAARRLGVDRRSCVVFEDTVPGLNAGRAAQMQAIGITTTYGHTRLAPADCVADFQDVTLGRTDGGLIRMSLRCWST